MCALAEHPVKLPGWKGWVRCAPMSRLENTYPEQTVSLVPVFLPGAHIRTRNLVPETIMPRNFGHPWGPPYALPVRKRAYRPHDNQVALLGSDLARAAKHPVIAPRPATFYRTRSDTRATGAPGGTDYFDVTFANPLAPSHSRIRSFNPLTSLNAAMSNKYRGYQGFISASPHRTRLLPIPIYTLGGWRPEAFSVVTGLAKPVANRAMEHFSKARSILLRRHAALVVSP